ncbi:MAG: helix-turn-helix transcriptional regulator [Deltaproteobacteria bacterium]|nr:helix-turn-helix transcriptional regulator [Deltaproteobacteria bacterium]
MARQPVKTLDDSRPDSGDITKFPDDPDIRVELAESFREEVDGQKLSGVAGRVRSRRGAPLHPSSVSRYLGGKIAPTLSVARRLAAAFNKPLGEVVAGVSARHRRRTEEWTRRLLYARPFRERTYAFIEQFSNVLGYCHFGLPTDPQRKHRRVTRPDQDRAEYVYFEVRLEKPLADVAPTNFILSFKLFDRPLIFCDYGAVRIERERIRGEEIWTRRSHVEPLRPTAQSFWVQTWIDGKAVDFVVRSSLPFTVGSMIWRELLPAGPLVIIPFHPGGVHRCGPSSGA